MQIIDCLPKMTKQYLSRVIDSIFKESIPKGDEAQLREQIKQNINYLADEERVRESLDLTNMNRTNRILTRAILSSLLEKSDLSCSEEDLYNCVAKHEQWITQKAEDPEAFAFSDKHSIDVYETALEVALKDKDVSQDEFQLLEKLLIVII